MMEKQYFCRDCKLALCPECKTDSQGPHFAHEIVILKAEYEAAQCRVDEESNKLEEKQKLFEVKRKELNDCIAKLEFQ